MAAFLIIVPADRPGELDELRSRLPGVTFERVCANVAAFGTEDGYSGSDRLTDVKRALSSHDCTLVEVGGYMIGRGATQEAIARALRIS